MFGLYAVWLVAIIYLEHIQPMMVARQCQWAEGDSTNILLVADPQLIDGHTYPGRPGPLLALSQHTVDVYIRQNYRAMVRSLRPDYIFFLGDYLDNGRLLLNEYYEQEFQRFEYIFAHKSYPRGDRWITSVPGNHDVGFGDGVKLQHRFEQHFGKPNHVRVIAGVEFVFLDTLLYSSSKPELRGSAASFVDGLPPKTMPRVLLSHVPLYRDTLKHACGPLRENPRFLLLTGYQYQLAIAPHLLEELLTKIEPDLIFSGDDHDYCDVTHDIGSVREVTVKSISMAMGIWKPAVQLLTIQNGADPWSYETHMCYLPRPYVDVVVYVAMAILTAVLLLVWNVLQRRQAYYHMTPLYLSVIVLATGEEVLPVPYPGIRLEKQPSTLVRARQRAANAANAARRAHYVFLKALRRWNLVAFARQCVLMGAAVIATYLVLVWV